MRLLLALVCVAAAVSPLQAGERPPQPLEQERSLDAAGLRRSYVLVRPRSVPAPVPLIIFYHGGGQTAAAARRYARFDELAETEKYLVVYAQGLGNNWNDGRTSGDLNQRAAANADDVEFSLQIIEQLEAEGLADPARIFLAGASNGGMMALRAGCALAGRIAGIAAVVANQPAEWRCGAKRMPALFIHGRDDDYMPFAGGQIAGEKSRRDLGQVLSVDETIGEFKRINGCPGVKETNTLDTVGRDDTKAVVTDYACKSAPLRHIVIEGGGHTWPGARERLVSDLLLGNTSDEVNATAEIWNFFKALQ